MRGGRTGAYRAESRKLSSQLAVRILALVCLIGPFAFAAVLRAQSGSPADTLFGALVHSSGFAVSLVVLSFAGSWGFPLLAGIVAGDMFSSEDRYGTWKTVLTRSCSRSDLFAGKMLAAATFAIALALLAMLSSLAAGVLIVGDQSLIGLGGTLLSPGHALGSTLASWLLCIPPVLAFASTGALLSIASRNGIVGVIGPSVIAVIMELLALVGAGSWAHMLLIASAFVTWPALFTAHPYFGPLVVGLLVCLLWTAACVAASWVLLRRRDFAGPAAARRRSWALPARVVLTAAVLIALIALAGNLGPAGVTVTRLQANITPNFENLTLLQQRLLGRVAPAGTKLNRASPLLSARKLATRARRMDVLARTVRPAAGVRALPTGSRQLRRERAVGRLLQGRVAAVVHRPADDARCRRPQRGEPPVHLLRLLQPALRATRDGAIEPLRGARDPG